MNSRASTQSGTLKAIFSQICWLSLFFREAFLDNWIRRNSHINENKIISSESNALTLIYKCFGLLDISTK